MTNVYQRRRDHRASTRRAAYSEKHCDILLGINAVQKRYEDAFQDLYGELPKITYCNGWYTTTRRYRRGDIESQTDIMLSKKHEQELNAPED